jgi:C1A family cysteine protease
MAALAFQLGQIPTNAVKLGATLVDDYKQALASGRCVAFAVPIYASTFNRQDPTGNAQRLFATGRIVLPTSSDTLLGGHAMCIVGYQDDTSIPALGGGRFIVRNSHGPEFGALSAFGPGYGTIPYSYVAAYGQEIGVAFA